MSDNFKICLNQICISINQSVYIYLYLKKITHT